MLQVFPIVFIGTFNVLIARHLGAISRRRGQLERSRHAPSSPRRDYCTRSDPDDQRERVWHFLTFRTLHEQTMARLTIAIAVVFIICNLPANTAYLQFAFQTRQPRTLPIVIPII